MKDFEAKLEEAFNRYFNVVGDVILRPTTIYDYFIKDEKMVEAKEILEMIGNVSPDRLHMLDKIDAYVHCYIMNVPYSDQILHSVKSAKYGYAGIEANYVRSRNGLKGIRPEGWTFSVDATLPEAGIEFVFHKKGFQPIVGKSLPTEELAELHAIIQVIEHDRKIIVDTRNT